MTARYIIGDTRDVLASLPDSSVDLVLSSPPFLALRSYLPADHPDKPFEIGSEQTPGAFLDVLLDVVEECGRVLAPHGTLAFELGDTYAGGATLDKRADENGTVKISGTNAYSEAHKIIRSTGNLDMFKGGDGWPLDKSLCLVPSTFAWALAYGRNPWTGRETPKWRVRNLVAWVRPNPPVGALGDKYRPATSYLTIACKARDRWFDLDAVRTEPDPQYAQRRLTPQSYGRGGDPSRFDKNRGTFDEPGVYANPAGAPPLDWWKVEDDTDHVAALAAENAYLYALLEQAGMVIEPDRFHPATSFLITAAKARDRWFDLDAVREPVKHPDATNVRPVRPGREDSGDHRGDGSTYHGSESAGAPPLDWWEIPTQPYAGSHYATWPEKLCVRPIESMCPREVCTQCGKPRRRIVETSRPITPDDSQRIKHANGERPAPGRQDRAPEIGWEVERTTLGWTDCGCGQPFRRGVVLDPFAGSGTTLAVAEGLGRDSIGIDLDARNADLAFERVGMFLSVEREQQTA